MQARAARVGQMARTGLTGRGAMFIGASGLCGGTGARDDGVYAGNLRRRAVASEMVAIVGIAFFLLTGMADASGMLDLSSNEPWTIIVT